MQSWRGLVAWRHRVLQKRLKRDPLRATEDEKDWLFLLEHRLLLHALVLSTDTNACSDRRRRWMQELLDAGDANAQGLDRQERTLLHHAVLQNWGIDDIAWVVKLFPGAAGAKDCDGFAPITYATLRGCCDEVILQMAIAVAKAVYADASQSFDGGNYEGCKRLLATATKETLSAVPHFDYAHVQAALALDAKAASTELLEYWAAFIALWGYFDPPEIIEDLTPKRRVALGSHVALTVAAKGEPLSYQWYCGDDVLSGCTSAMLDVTDSAAPEDEGQYWCRITNWRGGVCSAMLTLLVHDDTVVVDPSTRYYIPKDHRRGAYFNVLGNTGAVLEHGGVQLLVPPGSFRVVDLYDTDLASTRGMDVCMHVTTTAPDVVQPSPDEDFGVLVSPLVALRPTELDAFLTPWTLRLPHNVASYTTATELLVLELVVIDLDGNHAFRHVPASQCRLHETHVDIDVLALGTFAVAQRARHDALPKRRMSLALLIPPVLSMGPSHSVSVHAWVFPTRLDAIEAMATMLAAEADDVMLLETLSIQVRGTSMTAHLRFNRETITCSIGGGSLLEYVGAVPLQLDTAESCAMRGYGLVAKTVEVGLYRSVARERSYDAAVMLPITSTPCEGPTQARLLRHNPFGIQVSWVSPVQMSSSLPGTVLVELAPFSKTFWDRYKDMWWFERGHLSIVQRLYRVVHRGTLSEEPSTIVLTDVHAAALRVTIFNHDHVGTYCPPVLVTPDTLDKDDDDDLLFTGAAVPVDAHASPSLRANQSALLALVQDVYGSRDVVDWFGVDVNSILAWLDAQKLVLRTTQYSVGLLLAGLQRLEALAASVPCHGAESRFFVRVFGRLERVLPALDAQLSSDPSTSTQSLVNLLHRTLHTLFTTVYRCVAPGWLATFLVAEAASVASTLARALADLAATCANHAFFVPVPELLMLFATAGEAYGAQRVMDKDALRRQHAWSLLRSSTISMPLAATYLSALFQRDDVLTELQREDAMAKAHAIATERNTLASRILHLYPSDKDAVEYTAHVAVRFGGDVIDVDCLRVITVKNVTLGVRVSGAVAFDLLSRTATFVPTVPLEARSTFKLKLRAEAVTSWLGPVRSTLKLSFSTKPK